MVYDLVRSDYHFKLCADQMLKNGSNISRTAALHFQFTDLPEQIIDVRAKRLAGIEVEPRTTVGHATYRRRRQTVEPIFGIV